MTKQITTNEEQLANVLMKKILPAVEALIDERLKAAGSPRVNHAEFEAPDLDDIVSNSSGGNGDNDFEAPDL